MKVSQAYKDQIRAFEGTYKNSAGLHVAYNKGDTWTIGYGNTYYENGTAVKQGDTITETRALRLFSSVLDSLSQEVSRLLTNTVTQRQFDSICSLVYNIGVTAFRNSTILIKINRNPKDPAIATEFKRWIYSKGKVITGLVNRRAKESDYYFGLSNDSIVPTNMGFIALVIIVFVIFKLKRNVKQEINNS